MKLQQLTYLNHLVAHGMNVSEVARTLHTSQSGVSRFIAMLEDEIGVPLVVRERKRLLRLTPAGEAVHLVSKRIGADVDSLRLIAHDVVNGEGGKLTIATAHTHAKYTLPTVIAAFRKRYPRCNLRIRQGYLAQIVEWTKTGGADVFIGSSPNAPIEGLSMIPCYELHRVVFVPVHHPLLRSTPLRLPDLARYPIITYEEGSAARVQVLESFYRHNLFPDVVLGAIDIDVMKTYVRLGLGVAIAAHVAVDAKQDQGLRAIDAKHIFNPNTVTIGFRTDAYVTKQMAHFVQLFHPPLRTAGLQGQIRKA